jgi:tetraacyldisaccharide 4'-kinase
VDLTIKSSLNNWIEQYLFFPNPFQRLISICLFPLTIAYCIIVAYKRLMAKPFDFGIPVISIGNLVVGGTGKTPITIALAKKENKPAVVLRGYGRKSEGLYVVSQNGEIQCDVETSGDEAMLLAQQLPNATIIVSENRALGVLKAKELGCEIVFLDDGFRHHNIKKFDILIRPKEEPTNLFCLPSGGYRETKMMYSFVPVVLQDGKDFKRIITFKKDGNIIENLPEKSILVTAISKPDRLLEYLPKNIERKTFIDHYQFNKEDIDTILKDYKGYTIITTAKDMVKLEKFHLDNIILMDLEVEILKTIDYNL